MIPTATGERILPLSRGRRHLVEMGRAGSSWRLMAVTFGGVRAIDGYEDDAAGRLLSRLA